MPTDSTTAVDLALGPDIPLIAGAAGGGAAALLLLVGVLVFLGCRARKKADQQTDVVPPAGSELRQSNYGAIGLPVSEYEVGQLQTASEPRYASPSVLQSPVVGTEYSSL